MGPITRTAVITLAFAAALIVPALAALARPPTVDNQSRNPCWEVTAPNNAGAMMSICSSKINW